VDKYNIRFDNNCRIFVDAEIPSFIRALKDKIDEDSDYEQAIAYLKKSYPSVYDLTAEYVCHTCTLSKYNKEMLAQKMMEYHNGHMAIHPSKQKLITALWAATEDGR
jgi:hypothetical protein